MESDIKRAKLLAKLMDAQFNFRGVKFGIDPLINIIPGLGNIVGLMISFYILNIGRQVGISTFDTLRMIGNIVLDFIAGFIPLLGIIFDIGVKANMRNVKILEKYEMKAKLQGPIVDGQIIS